MLKRLEGEHWRRRRRRRSGKEYFVDWKGKKKECLCVEGEVASSMKSLKQIHRTSRFLMNKEYDPWLNFLELNQIKVKVLVHSYSILWTPSKKIVHSLMDSNKSMSEVI